MDSFIQIFKKLKQSNLALLTHLPYKLVSWPVNSWDEKVRHCQATCLCSKLWLLNNRATMLTTAFLLKEYEIFHLGRKTAPLCLAWFTQVCSSFVSYQKISVISISGVQLKFLGTTWRTVQPLWYTDFEVHYQNFACSCTVLPPLTFETSFKVTMTIDACTDVWHLKLKTS